MPQANKVKLEFTGRGPTVRFANEEEFFETLGIICREDYSTEIKGKKQEHPISWTELSPGMGAYEAGMKTIAERGTLVYDLTGLYIKVLKTIYFTKAFYDIIKEPDADRISCAAYVDYLLEEGYAKKTVKDNENVVSIKVSYENVKTAMKEKGLEEYLYFLDRGLKAPKMT